MKKIRLAQLFIRIQKYDFMERNKKISLKVHFRDSFALPEGNFFSVWSIFIQISMLGVLSV